MSFGKQRCLRVVHNVCINTSVTVEDLPFSYWCIRIVGDFVNNLIKWLKFNAARLAFNEGSSASKSRWL